MTKQEIINYALWYFANTKSKYVQQYKLINELTERGLLIVMLYIDFVPYEVRLCTDGSIEVFYAPDGQWLEVK